MIVAALVVGAAASVLRAPVLLVLLVLGAVAPCAAKLPPLRGRPALRRLRAVVRAVVCLVAVGCWCC